MPSSLSHRPDRSITVGVLVLGMAKEHGTSIAIVRAIFSQKIRVLSKMMGKWGGVGGWSKSYVSFARRLLLL